jgi:hypothetical protein
MNTTNKNRAHAIREWIKRREVKGISPTGDDIWNHINQCWPSLLEQEREEIFQASVPAQGRLP